jgi:hypothetical protein
MDEEPSLEKVEARRRWFEAYLKTLERNSIIAARRPGFSYRCPCCGFKTLTQRGGFEICQVCFWEDDGQDDHDADTIRGGPNGVLSLSAGRRSFKALGACEARMKSHVRPPRDDER